MGLKMIFKIKGVQLKLWFLGGNSQKTNINGGFPKKRVYDSLQIEEGTWQKRVGGFSETVLIPQCTLWIVKVVECAQVHQLPQNQCVDNQEHTLYIIFVIMCI